MPKNEVDNNNRPVEKSHLEIAETFQDAGTRPIEGSAYFLVPDPSNRENETNQAERIELSQNQNEINDIPPLD